MQNSGGPRESRSSERHFDPTRGRCSAHLNPRIVPRLSSGSLPYWARAPLRMRPALELGRHGGAVRTSDFAQSLDPRVSWGKFGNGSKLA